MLLLLILVLGSIWLVVNIGLGTVLIGLISLLGGYIVLNILGSLADNITPRRYAALSLSEKTWSALFWGAIISVFVLCAVLSVTNQSRAQGEVVPIVPKPVKTIPVKPDTVAPVVPSKTPPPASRLILPPQEYDHPYTTGELSIERVDSIEELFKKCVGIKVPWALGCNIRHNDGSSCRIFIVKDNVLHRYGWWYEAVLRHEMGHCNGWGGDHAGQRAWNAK